MKMIRTGRKYRQQQGYLLALSLVIMLFGTLVVGGMLTYTGASVNARGIARDNLDAYYAADAGIQLVIARLIEVDAGYIGYIDPDTGELAPLAERYDGVDPGTPADGIMQHDVGDALHEYYLPVELFSGLSDEINGYKIRMTVKHVDWLPEYAKYRITAYVFESIVDGTTKFSEATDWVRADVRQIPFPVIDARGYQAIVDSWQRL